jgi:hypothetical protein
LIEPLFCPQVAGVFMTLVFGPAESLITIDDEKLQPKASVAETEYNPALMFVKF